MSYNYDLNPWDDNYNNNAGQASNQQQSSSNYATGYNEGYNNPMAQHFDADTPQQYAASFESSQQQDQQETQQPPPPPPTQRSPLRRFIDQHIPICGSFIDTMSGINLPFIDALVQHVNRDLLVSKMFYFFFYSAFGSLFPLMGVYFKQLGMNPAQVGILTGVRPFIEIFSAPFWHSLAERFQKSKALLLFSLLSWIIFTYSLAHIRPPASACVAFNDTNYVLYTPYSANDLSNYDVDQTEDADAIEEKGSSRGNEIFMNMMPQSGESNRDREGKDQILASEENQNDQRRRRKKRQTSDQEIDQAKKKYAYSVEGKGDDLYSSHVDFNVDLDNDYEDRPIAKPDASFINSHHHQQHDASFFDLEMSDTADGPEYDEFEQSYSKSQRYKRGASMKEVDDLLGESEENESEDTSESRSEMSNKATKERAGSNAGEDGEGEGESSENDTENEIEYDNGKREPGSGKTTQQQKQSTVTTEKTLTLMTEGSQQLHQEGKIVNKTKRVFKQRHKTPPTHIVGMSPITVEYAVNYNKDKHSQFVTPMFSTIVYKLDDIKEVFFLLLLLISLGEFFSAPALTLADSATLGYLGDNTDLYGRQRMFGSFSWAVTLLLVGMALDNATSIADHPCGPHQRERSYTVCFIIFSLLMACAFLTATQFRFSYLKGNSGVSQALIASANDGNNKVVTTSVDPSATGDIDELYASTQPRSIFNTAPPVNAPPPNAQHGSGKEKLEFLDKWKSAVFAQRTRELPEWVNVFRQFRNSLHLMYLFITWFLGCGVGLVFTFLFWHLQDVGGTPTLFGICSVINHISEILAYFFSFSFIKRFGHTKVLSVGLGCNVIRFLYVAFLTNPYYALPFELVQGITHAACFAACCSYTSHVSKPELRTSTQGVMQGLHHGIGRACGALIGGYMINAIGSRASFCIYGLLSGCVLAGFLYVRKKASELKDEEVKVDDSEALGGYGAPQGVPSAIPGKIAQTVSPQDIDYQW